VGVEAIWLSRRSFLEATSTKWLQERMRDHRVPVQPAGLLRAAHYVTRHDGCTKSRGMYYQIMYKLLSQQKFKPNVSHPRLPSLLSTTAARPSYLMLQIVSLKFTRLEIARRTRSSVSEVIENCNVYKSRILKLKVHNLLFTAGHQSSFRHH